MKEQAHLADGAAKQRAAEALSNVSRSTALPPGLRGLTNAVTIKSTLIKRNEYSGWAER